MLYQVYEKENSEFKPVKLRLKITLCHILLVSRGLGKHTHTTFDSVYNVISVQNKLLFFIVIHFLVNALIQTLLDMPYGLNTIYEKCKPKSI